MVKFNVKTKSFICFGVMVKLMSKLQKKTYLQITFLLFFSLLKFMSKLQKTVIKLSGEM